MALNGKSSPEPPTPGAGTRPKQYLAFISKVAADLHGRLPSMVLTRESLGPRLLGSILLFSGCVTLILTVLQLYFEYRHDVSALELRLEQISKSNLSSLTESLWELDEKQLRLQLTGILQFPDMRAVEVRAAGDIGDAFDMRLGEFSAPSAIIREYPLRRDVQGRNAVIGTLYVQATLADIYRRLYDTALIILLRQAAKTFLVSVFIVCIFHYLVTRHLFAIAHFVANYRIGEPQSPLRLERPPRRHEDELERLVTAFNRLSDDLQLAYRSFHHTNDQLARELAARRQAEATVREREARIRRLVDANIIGIFMWDFEGNILEANDAFLQMVAYEREDLAAGRLSWANLTPPEWRDRDAQMVREHKMTGVLQPTEKEYFRKNGERVPVLIGAATFEQDGNQGVAFVLDLTERKRAEQALREREAKIRRLVDANIIGVFVADLQGRIIEANDEFLRIVGYGREYLLASRMHVVDMTPLEWRDRTAQTMTEIGSGKTVQPYEKEYFRKDGSRVPVLVGSTLFDGSNLGVPLGVVFVVDLTQRKRAEAEARESERRHREMQVELAHANRVATMGRLTASIAHEVNQPIAATITNAQAALRFLDAPSVDMNEVRQILNDIVKDGSRAGEVISRIRDLVKKAPTRRDRWQMNGAISEVIELARGEAAKNSVSVHTDLADGLPTVEGDRVQLQQVLLNLIINAIEAMNGLGEGPRELSISSGTADSGGVLVTVCDSGPGLTPAGRDRLFETFYTTKPSGLGLGLSICRSIVEAHGGRLWASANVPRGAIFQFTVPAAMAVS
ncbi:PAS domain S-box protein [Bradyrhizobium diazoefficiens]|uniref:PAS domain S-box protein n=1 Tax=Bradyrhizobium diazoefficiens TaxID=1355477 RepID=UPI00190C41B4|nr:PAS domain S-box protein [Bradyrhizobium diazoefficiens]QQO16837.1 PAS domain S-box protein [Bradyrhizobium diazoefficiens]